MPPDLVAEVTSPGTRSLDLVEKAAIYAEIGVAAYWVVDLTRECVVVHARRAEGPYEAGERTDGVVTSPVAPGLQVAVGDLVPAR